LFDARFVPRLLAIAGPLLVGGLVVGWLAWRWWGAVAGAGTFLGLGLGGFIDGILLHQMLHRIARQRRADSR
jgi:hypothetical protein